MGYATNSDAKGLVNLKIIFKKTAEVKKGASAIIIIQYEYFKASNSTTKLHKMKKRNKKKLSK
jgi:hypothetical protein